MNGAPLPNILPMQIHVEGVAHLLSNIQADKASGPDNLLAKEVVNQIAPTLAIIIFPSIPRPGITA